MEGRKWEDLSADCLVNVFGRLGIESLLLDVPFVCKLWLNATLSPLCWQELDFSQITLHPCHFIDKSRIVDEYQLKCNRSVTEFIKYVVKHSERSATFILLPDCCTEEALLCVADECPDLKVLLLSCITPRDNLLQMPNLVSKWKNLEFLGLLETFLIQEVFTQISIHCKNFIGLAIVIAIIKQDVAPALVTILPSLKQITIRNGIIQKKNLGMILQGCKELEYLDVSYCIGFDEADEEILKLASHIRTFKHEGSRLSDDYDDYFCYQDTV